MAACSIHDLVRALTHPYVGAHFLYRGEVIKVWKTEVCSDVPSNLEPGKVLLINDDGILVKTGIGAIRLCESVPLIQLSVGDYL